MCLIKDSKNKILSDRELEILRYSKDGYTSKEIAKFTNLHPKTVENHLSNIQIKLEAKNIRHAISIAYEKKLFATTN